MAIAACAAKVPPSESHGDAAGAGATAQAALSQQEAPGAPVAAPRQVAANRALEDPVLARGKELFAKQCAICHGEAGDGAGQFAYLMNPGPRNFQQGNFKLATTQNQIPTDEDLLRTISRGMPGSAMPPWNHLPLSDLQALIRFVRPVHIDVTKAVVDRPVAEGKATAVEAAELFAKRTEPGKPLVIPPEPASDDIRWFRGRRLYLEGCASCHGIDG